MSEPKLAVVGDNNPPDPIDEALAPYADAIEEAQNWLDGDPITTEEQMRAVDAILKDVRKAGTDVGNAKKSAVAPLHDAWKAEGARWKPTEDDLNRLKKGLVALVDPVKKRIAAEKEAAKRKAYQEAETKRLAAIEAAQKAEATDINAQRVAAAAQKEAEAAQKQVAKAKRDTEKGLRTVTKYKIEDHRAVLNDIADNDRGAITAFIDEYVRRHHRGREINGVKVWQEKEVY